MRDRCYFAAYSGGECILKCQGRNMKVTTYYTTTYETTLTYGPDTTTTAKEIHVSYIDDDGNPQLVTLSPNAVWTLERGS